MELLFPGMELLFQKSPFRIGDVTATRRESCETVTIRKRQVTGRTFKTKLQADLLTRPVQQLMGGALDDPEPGA